MAMGQNSQIAGSLSLQTAVLASVLTHSHVRVSMHTGKLLFNSIGERSEGGGGRKQPKYMQVSHYTHHVPLTCLLPLPELASSQ